MITGVLLKYIFSINLTNPLNIVFYYYTCHRFIVCVLCYLMAFFLFYFVYFFQGAHTGFLN